MSMNNQNVVLCKGLQQLKDEHVGLLKMLDDLKVSSEALLAKSNDISDEFEQLTKDLNTFYDDLAPHSEKEEEVLFKMMGEYLPKSGGPIEVMEAEHDRARDLIHHYVAEVEKSGNSLSIESMKKLANSVIQVHQILTDHFAKEENVLFPMAERMFSDKEKQILAEKLIP